MTLLQSLLDAIVRLEGDALVMHVGEKPYVVTTSSAMNAYRGPLAWGQVELSSRVLTPDAVMNMVGQILPVDQRHALEEVGAVEHAIESPAGVADRFTVVAARGGDDIWLELRRHPAVIERDPHESANVETPSSETAAYATPETASTAVGLQEPPPTTHDPRDPSTATSGETREPAVSSGNMSTGAGGPASDSAPAHSPVEERVPVLDEVTLRDTEHVEHIFIPLQDDREPRAAVGEHDGTLEIVEPEIQGSPTEEDVESILASTAAALLSASMTSDSAGLQEIEFTHVPAEDVSDQHFEVVTEDTGLQQDVVPEDDSVDLTSALDEMPAASWSPRQAEVPEPEALPERAGMPPPAVLAMSGTVAADASAAAPHPDAAPIASGSAADAEALDGFAVPAPPATTSVAGEGGSHVEHETVAAPESDAEPELTPAAAPNDHQQSLRHTDTRQAAPAELQDERDQHHLIQPEKIVEKTASVSAAETSQGAPAPRIAAAASGLPQSGVVTPIGRGPGRLERPAPGRRVDDESAVQMLRTAADRGASTVYVVAQSKPMIRIDGDISTLDDSVVLTDADIERLVSTLEPQRTAGSPGQAPAEWISEVPQVGRVRCVTFRDHRGPGIIFRLIPARSISADHLDLSPQIRELAALTDGLVLVTGGRGSGKSTLLNSLVDLINGSRGEHVITVETAIGFVHESRRSFVSQREVGDDIGTAAAAASAALREDPDVLVIEDLKSGDAVTTALQAAESGRLVFVSISAPSSAGALEAVVNLVPAAERAAVRASLAAVLRGVVAQLLLRKSTGGHVAARELLLNSPAVSASIKQGESSGLGVAFEEGARHGMLRLNDSLAALIKEGTVHGAEVYRRAPDRAGLLASLARDGVDTSFAERLA